MFVQGKGDFCEMSVLKYMIPTKIIFDAAETFNYDAAILSNQKPLLSQGVVPLPLARTPLKMARLFEGFPRQKM